MIKGPLTKATAEDIERAISVADEDDGDALDYLSPEAQAELERRALQVSGRFFMYIQYHHQEEVIKIFEACLREYCDDMEFSPEEIGFHYGFLLSCMMAVYEGLMGERTEEVINKSLDWYRDVMLEVAEQMRNIKLERIAADKAKKLGIDTDSKAYSNLLKIMRTDLNSHISVTKQSVRASVHGTLGRTGKAYLQKWKDSQKP